MTKHPNNVLDFLDYKARRKGPDMPERLQRTVTWREWERILIAEVKAKTAHIPSAERRI